MKASLLSERANAALKQCEDTDIEMNMARTQRAINRAKLQHWDALRSLFHILSIET